VTAALRCRLGDFNATSAFEKLGHLIAASAEAGFSTHRHKQTDAWREEFQYLETTAKSLIQRMPKSESWSILLEYDIPRRGKRPDAVVLADDLIFVLEFKFGAEAFRSADEWQAVSYGLDLRDFHAASLGRRIFPVLIATGGQTRPVNEDSLKLPRDRLVAPVQFVGDDPEQLALRLERLHDQYHDPDASVLFPEEWELSAYRPTPTIIEAAETLFAGHSVADISHSFAHNLDVTSNTLVRAIQQSQRERRRTICFVTGIPGSGKTLAGLNAVHSPEMRQSGRPAGVFLSGNGPLVKIVREALIRDQQRRGQSRSEAKRIVSTFIANVHQFLVTYGLHRTTEPPYENAIVFDEAQRAWDADAVLRKHEVDKSEPQLVLEIMERAEDWATIIALVGGGQEIHKGEAGLEEWGRALIQSKERWRVLVSPDVISGGASVAGHRLFNDELPTNIEVVELPELHLAVSVRSPRAHRLGEWVNSLLLGRVPSTAHERTTSEEYPIVMTRDLAAAKAWLRAHADPQQRIGMLASSGALRLRAHGIELSSGFRQGYPYADWFLSDAEDTRSSFQLEVAATEFECQGLELDWTLVCWGGDFLIDPSTTSWAFRNFRGTRWQNVRRVEDQRYIANKYRVLLTRARRGMVLWIPPGDAADPSRLPQLLDATAEFLAEAGISLVM
jgi:hypothetical protein